MENLNRYMTIHKFSQLTHTTTDTLKHYDDIGLLKPAYVGRNHYRYYLPEQSLDLTRILFAKNASIPLKEIRDFLLSEDDAATMEKYSEIRSKLSANISEIQEILNTIGNLKYYYSFAQRYQPGELFAFYLPEWFIVTSGKAGIGADPDFSESDIANELFIHAFSDEKWPHYLLQALFTEEEARERDFSKITYFLKVDKPERHPKERVWFIPNGEWTGMLFYADGSHIADCVNTYLDRLAAEQRTIKGPVFIMDVVNCLITSRREKYCTMIYAMEKEQPYEEY